MDKNLSKGQKLDLYRSYERKLGIFLWEIFKAINSRMMLDKCDGGHFFAELFENDNTF